MDDENNGVSTETAETITQAPSQAKERTEREKVEYNLRKKAEEARELGVDPAEVLGVKAPLQVSDDIPGDKPLTVNDLRELQRQDARQTAVQMANEISDDLERKAVLDELRYIVPSGDAAADFRRAQASANAERNARIAEEAAGKGGQARRTASGGSVSVEVEQEFTPTEAEMVFMRPPYNMSKEKILAARRGQ